MPKTCVRSGWKYVAVVAFLAFAAVAVFGGGMATAADVGAINDILKGGSGAAPADAPPPSAMPAGPRDTGAGFIFSSDDEGVAAPPSGCTPQSANITYQGQAAADGRKARIELQLDGIAASGKIWMQSVCEANVRLGGADLTFAGTLSGPWESDAASIDGTWQGVEHFCGSDVENNGSFKFFMKEEFGRKFLHLRVEGKRGRYGWNFAPGGRSGYYVDPASACPPKGPVTAGAPGPDVSGKDLPKEDGTAKGDEPKKPEPADTEEIDLDKVVDIVVLPDTIEMKPGEAADFPTVFAIMPGGKRVPFPADVVEWKTARNIGFVDGRLQLSGWAKPGDRMFLAFRIKKENLDFWLGQVLVHVIAPEERTGSIKGRVLLIYPLAMKGMGPKSPLAARVELRRGDSVIAVANVGPNGAYEFKGLRRGNYTPYATFAKLPALPTGARLERPTPPWRGEFQYLPSDLVFNHKTQQTENDVWDFEHVDVSIDITDEPLPEDTYGMVYGQCLHKGKGVESVAITVIRADGEVIAKTASRKEGKYQIKLGDLPAGNYYVRAEKYVVDGWAGPDDLLDVATNRDEAPIIVGVPMSSIGGLKIDIEMDTRHTIFGGIKGSPQPEDWIPRGAGGTR